MSPLQNALQALLAIMMGVNIAVIGWGIQMVMEHETRLAVIESNRFTDKDAHAIEAEIYKVMPGEWARQRIKEHERRIIRLEPRRRGDQSKSKAGTGGEG